MFDVYLAGTGGMKPLPDRALTGLWVEYGGRAFLVDCGEGMQISLARCGRSLAKLDAILITHFHADHIAGLPGLLLSAGNAGKTGTLDIYAPPGAEYYISGLRRICPELPFETAVHELDDNGGSIDLNGLRADYIPLHHTIPCFGYRFTEERPPVFSPEKAKALGVPVNLWKQLHSGNSVEADGKTITSDMVCGEKRAPLRVTYITDTAFFPELIDFAKGSDLLISEGMYAEDEYIPKMQEKGHMVFSQSAEIASGSNSKELWLTHFSPALDTSALSAESLSEVFNGIAISLDGKHKTIR